MPKLINKKTLITILLTFGLLLVGCEKTSIKDIDRPRDPADYVGRYLSKDGDPLGSYIELHDDFTFKRNSNFCEGYSIIEGNYSVNEENGYVIITLTTIKVNSKTDDWGDAEFSFKYQNNELYFINDGDENMIYDCSLTSVFAKESEKSTTKKSDGANYDIGSNTNDIVVNITSLSGKYYAVNPDNGKKVKDSYFEFKANGTYLQNYNMCEGFYKIKGTYTIDSNVITLTRTKGKAIYTSAVFIINGNELIVHSFIRNDGSEIVEGDENFYFDCSYTINYVK